MVGKYGANLPFLFKVLSINEPLSIQSHPDKELAKVLHAKDPKNYPDDNFSNYFNATDDQSRKVGLKECFKSIVERDDVTIETAIQSLVTNFTGESTKSDLSQLLLRVSQKYPKYVGCLCLFFLNYVKLKPFERERERGREKGERKEGEKRGREKRKEGENQKEIKSARN